MESVKTTVCILNWKRPDNVRAILEALYSQQPAVEIFLWNNGPPMGFHADWIVQSSRNARCSPRWWMACQARTPYVVILDDDLCPTNVLTIDSLVGRCDGRQIVGPFGAVWQGRYSQHTPIRFPNEDTRADVIKGRCMAMPTATLRDAIRCTGVLSARTVSECYDDLAIAEDIAVCGAVCGGTRGYHLVPGGLNGYFSELPEGREALSLRGDHMPRRNAVAERWFR
jgi:hypothetical protein